MLLQQDSQTYYRDMLLKQMEEDNRKSQQANSSPGQFPSLGGNNYGGDMFKNLIGRQGSYMGGSGPATGSFRGAQEVGLGSTSAAAPQSAGMSNLGGMTSGQGMGAAGPAMPYAYLIGKGKMMENDRLKENPDDFTGNLGLAMLAPSFNQIKEDPKGMGLPTALGLPFLTPFTGSKKAKQKEPEWAGLWNSFGLG